MMDTLPKIGISPEGMDTFLNVLERLRYFGITVRLSDGSERMGFLAGTSYVDNQTVVSITEVDQEWEGTGQVSNVPVDDIDEILVH